MITSSGRAAAAAAVAAALLGVSACTSSNDGSGTADTAGQPRLTTPAATAPHPRPGPARNPLTGIGPVPRTPVIAVKIDDTAAGRPQVGIDRADIVYIEAVEAGLTRVAAIFGTNKPTVGYVRSTRPSDPELLRQYGRITEAYSGGQHVSLKIRRKSGLTGWSNDAGAAGFYRVSRASDYINVQLDLATVAKKTHTNRPQGIAWTFAAGLRGLRTRPAPKVETQVTGSYPAGHGTPVEFRYDRKLRKYVRYIDGVEQHAADGKPIAATNVVVQSCRIESYPADRDVNGNPAQFTHSVGRGHVVVFRQGRRIDGTWSRRGVTSGTALRTASGRTLPLAPGNTWVVLIRSGVPVGS